MGAPHLAHPAFADLRGDFVDAETGAGGEGQAVRDYTGRIARRPRLLLPDADLVTEPQNALGPGLTAETAGRYRHPFIQCHRSCHASATVDSANTW